MYKWICFCIGLTHVVFCHGQEQKKNSEKFSAYLFAYFTGADESIYFALSDDGYNYRALNNNKPILNSSLISSTGGVRDPHILRGADGRTFYMVATDLHTNKDGWGPNHAMVFLKSEDLVNWSSHIINIAQTFPDFAKVNRVWAPQTIYDPEKQKYMVYWSMRFGNEPDKLFYAYANKDFTGLEIAPAQLFFSPTNGACIDADIIFKDGKYHLFFKTEGAGNGIKKAVSDKLTEGYVLNDKYLDQTNEDVEGSGIFKLNNVDEWILMYDVYRRGKYQFTKTTDLLNFNVIDNEVSMNFHPRHGTVMPITSSEADALAKNVFTQSDDYSLSVDVKQRGKPLRPIWAHFGYDEPNYTYMKDGKKLLSELSALSPVPVYVRAHNLLTSGDGVAALKWGSTNAYTEDKKGKPVYNWVIVDSIIDTYIERGMKPLVEIGFMPEALSVQPQPYRHEWKPGVDYNKIYTGWAYPPKDYKKWGELVHEWVKHSIERYGKEEVKSWWWEVWNEPNIGYWKGTPEEFFMLYDYAADGVKRALPEARIGGPSTTGPGWDKAAVYLKNFLQHCADGKNYATGKTGSPLDFISFHGKGSPKVVNGHVRMNMSSELTDAAKGFEIVNGSAFKDLPILITEFDPEGCAACGMATNPENAYRNGTMYSSYTASSFARLYDLADRYGVNLEGATSWSFEFEDQRWFEGFRDLATHGVDKPVLNVFRMYGLIQGNRLNVSNPNEIPLDSILKTSVRGKKPDVHALAVANNESASIMIWNYHDADVPMENAKVKVDIKNIPSKKVLLHHYRIDKDHSNSYELWKRMGSPQNVSDEQYNQLEKAGQLQLLHSPKWIPTTNGAAVVEFSLPAQGVSLITVTYQ